VVVDDDHTDRVGRGRVVSHRRPPSGRARAG
jgi:hypothetical protein